eukprot:TCALIF_06229-PA protein Name:"Protein of unknown function" AED:0.06 eAED:0.40 QI:0/0.5/0.66/1/0.5/0.33/3/217/148
MWKCVAFYNHHHNNSYNHYHYHHYHHHYHHYHHHYHHYHHHYHHHHHHHQSDNECNNPYCFSMCMALRTIYEPRAKNRFTIPVEWFLSQWHALVLSEVIFRLKSNDLTCTQPLGVAVIILPCLALEPLDFDFAELPPTHSISPVTPTS